MKHGVTVTSRNALAKQTGRTGEPCEQCSRKLRADEPAVVRGWTRMVGIATYTDGTQGLYTFVKDHGARCVGCANLRRVSERVWQFVFEYKGRERAATLYREEPCAECGRPTIRFQQHFNRKHTFCCEPCEVAFHNHRRRKPKEEKVCEVCGEEFTANRADAKTCSPACKQKAYRRRKGAS